MEFITVEQFKEQSKEVQQVFLDWWKPSIGDIYSFIDVEEYSNDMSIMQCLSSQIQITVANRCKGEGNRIPLFTEGQLRKFIESKTKSKLMIEYTCCENIVIKLAKINKTNGCFEVYKKSIFQENKYNLLKAYWKVACSVAEEGLNG